MKKRTRVTAIFMMPLAFSVAAQEHINVTHEEVTTGISLGTLSGLTKERVYDPANGGRKVSQLDWKYRNAAIIQGDLEWQVRSWLSFGAAGWTTLDHKGSKMDDYDWLSASQDKWTHHSSHPDTRLNFANQWDLHLTGWIFNEPDWRVGLLAGYQQSRFSFSARGGIYQYENGAYNGTLPDVKTIGYGQRFDVPYIGLTGLYRYNNFEAGGSLKYSGWTRAKGTDRHYLRSLTFIDKTQKQDFFSLSANVGYYVTQNAKVYLEGTWNRTMNKKADDTVIFSEGDNYGRTAFKNGAGIESYSLLATAGLKYSF
ncbi:omptin family outer membrane protease [Kosakonia sp. H02]|nr:omptin family outer membrane protease [Kosakonia sp. H02]